MGMCVINEPFFVTHKGFHGIVSPEQFQYQVGAKSPFAPVTNTVFILGVVCSVDFSSVGTTSNGKTYVYGNQFQDQTSSAR